MLICVVCAKFASFVQVIFYCFSLYDMNETLGIIL